MVAERSHDVSALHKQSGESFSVFVLRKKIKRKQKEKHLLLVVAAAVVQTYNKILQNLRTFHLSF